MRGASDSRGIWLRRCGVCGHGLREMTNVGHELPYLLIRQLPAGHGSVSNAVVDEVKQFAVSSFSLRKSQAAQVQRRRIHAATRGRPAAAIVPMAGFTIFLIKLTSGDGISVRAAEGIFQ